MNRTYYAYLLVLLLFTSCEEEVPVLSENKDKILFECELQAYNEIRAKAYFVNDLNEISRNKIANNLTIRMTTGIDEEISFKYNPRENYYYVEKSLHVPTPGKSYNIAVISENQEYKIFSKTTVSQSGKLTGVVSKPVEDVIMENGKGKKFQITASYNNPYLDKHYIKFNAYRRLKNGKLELLKFEGNDEEPLAFHTSNIDGSVIADLNRIDLNRFTLNFSTFGPVKNSEVLDKVILEIQTVTESVYRYTVAKSKQINAFNNGSFIPVVTYTNFENGFGYFGSCTARIDSIEIK